MLANDIVVKELEFQPHFYVRFHTCQTLIDQMKENDFIQEKRQEPDAIPNKEFTDADNADDIALQAESLLLIQVAGIIDLSVNADHTGYMCFNQKGDISTLKVGSMKLIDNFTNLGNSVSSMENDINIRLAKEWTAVDWLWIIRKSNQSDKMIRKFSKQRSNMWMHHMDAD